MAENWGSAVIGPAEFALLVKIYNVVLAEPWFTTDDLKRNRSRRHIIEAFRAGIAETDQLTAHCRDLARHHFSTSRQRPATLVKRHPL